MTLRLGGLKVVVTRAPHQAGSLIELLTNVGAEPVLVPLIRVAISPDQDAALAAAFQRGNYDWLVVTSANAASAIQAFLPAFAGRVAAVGATTAGALAEFGTGVDLLPPEFVADSLAQAFPSGDGRVLLPQAEAAAPALAETLRDKGWFVDAVSAYRTIAAEVDDAGRAALKSADVITFASPSAVEAYVELRLPPVATASIGPVTSAALRANGFEVNTEASDHTASGLVKAIERLVED